MSAQQDRNTIADGTAGVIHAPPAVAPNPAGPKEILAARARALAAAPEAETAGERIEVIEFELSGERYAVRAALVTEIFPLTDFTPLFCAPAFVLGITNLRGKIVSIVDLRRFFELPSVGLSNLNRVILASDGVMEVGILADAIAGIVSLPVAELQAPPAALTGVREEFLTGVTGDRLALLDLGRILADRRIVVHEEVE
ncbi:chemotaxis protein CheW [Geomesophilobacter sediminis]|uniref:Chemotaxis protein CheW n=1 Tax=Geomesophilobacter sediminis TaxID=2798584 RepID=A0A8J7J7M2_9BACT|nr:chemotaxis protein CheW [Geomesophilobacter sediminis]MBJ6725306.1 chemotaxis protein CheW [Geomesophilobacter sediminis]